MGAVYQRERDTIFSEPFLVEHKNAASEEVQHIERQCY
jgi:hypothetical protein